MNFPYNYGDDVNTKHSVPLAAAEVQPSLVTVTEYEPVAVGVMDWVFAVNPPGPVQLKV